MTAASNPPAKLDAIADIVLAYRPKPTSKLAKRRKRKANKVRKKEKGECAMTTLARRANARRAIGDNDFSADVSGSVDGG